MNGNILLTGVTDGIGLALANLYTQNGWRVLGVGRRPAGDGQQPLRPPNVYLQTDLSLPGAADIISALLPAHGITRLDALIHNAAQGWVGPAADHPSASIDALLATNIYAPITLTHALLPRLIAAHGVVAFVSSVFSVLPAPEFAVYNASKAAIDGFARNLRIELRGKVDVLTLWPGATATGIHAKSGMSDARIARLRRAQPEQVAESIFRSVRRRRSGATNAANSLLRWMAPRFEGILDPLMINAGRRKS